MSDFGDAELDMQAQAELEARRRARFGVLESATAEGDEQFAGENNNGGAGSAMDDAAAQGGPSGLGEEEEEEGDTSALSFPRVLPAASMRALPAADRASEVAAFDPQAPRRWDAVHLFGARMLSKSMTSQHVLAHFAAFSPTGVEWISDTQCNVLFADVFAAKDALLALSDVRDKDVEAATAYIIAHSVAVDFAEEDLPLVVWRMARGGGVTARTSLCMRVATTMDVKGDADARAPSAYYTRVRAHMQQRARATRVRTAAANKSGVDVLAGFRSGDDVDLTAPIEPDAAGRQRKGRGFRVPTTATLPTMPDTPSAAAHVRVTRPADLDAVAAAATYNGSATGEWEGSHPATLKHAHGKNSRVWGQKRLPDAYEGAARKAVQSFRPGRARYNPLAAPGEREKAGRTKESALAERPRLDVPGVGAGAQSGGVRGVYAETEAPLEGTSAMFLREVTRATPVDQILDGDAEADAASDAQ